MCIHVYKYDHVPISTEVIVIMASKLEELIAMSDTNALIQMRKSYENQLEAPNQELNDVRASMNELSDNIGIMVRFVSLYEELQTHKRLEKENDVRNMYETLEEFKIQEAHLIGFLRETRSLIDYIQSRINKITEYAAKWTTKQDLGNTLSEFCRQVKLGKKQLCCMWFVFPTMPWVDPTGRKKPSEENKLCAMDDIRFYLLSNKAQDRYIQVCEAVELGLKITPDIVRLIGPSDAPKLKSSLQQFELYSRGSCPRVNLICQRLMQRLRYPTLPAFTSV